MDFIGDQERARTRTTRLVFLFIIAVVGIVAMVYAVFATGNMLINNDPEEPIGFWQPGLFLLSSSLTLLVILGGSLVKVAQLAGGGKAVAGALGGSLVHPDTSDPHLKRLVNVVEEMAIASGCPVPPVYLIDDPSINAFAAGFTVDNAVIGVTTGCVTRLSRDELQGVMAHEFSHIVHGDMKLNIRLTGLIFGIMALGFLGYICFRFIGPVLARSGGGKNNPGPALGLAIIVGGLALMAIGSLGTPAGSQGKASALGATSQAFGGCGDLFGSSQAAQKESTQGSLQLASMTAKHGETLGPTPLPFFWASHPSCVGRGGATGLVEIPRVVVEVLRVVALVGELVSRHAAAARAKGHVLPKHVQPV